MKKIMLTAGALALMAGQLLADGHEGPLPEEMPPADMPQITLMLPPAEGEPPMDPEEAKDWLLGIVYPMMDTDGSGGLSYEEVRVWMAWVHIPPMEHMEHPHEPPPEGEPPLEGELPPEGELCAHCGDFIGNHVEFSLSISTGPTAMAITLPEAREGGCFHLEVMGCDLETMANEFQII